MNSPELPGTALTGQPADKLRRAMGQAPRPFRDFMKAALYAPGAGYYARGGVIFGAGGDYVTAATLDAGLGYCLARIFREVAAALDAEPADFVDAGAGDGALLAALAEEFRAEPAPIRALVGIEASAALRRAIARRLRGTPHQVAPRPPRGAVWRGVLCAYELFDALPVHLLRGTEGEPEEMWVEWKDVAPAWRPGPLSDRAILGYLSDYGIRLAPGQLAEVNLDAAPLLGKLLDRFERGLILIFDYGARASRLYDRRTYPAGTLTAHFRHQAHRDLLARPGEQDLTAHVNFSALEATLRDHGAAVLGFAPLAHILLAAGLAERLAAHAALEEEPGAAERESHRRRLEIVAPTGMGEAIRTLVAWKGRDAPDLPFLRPLAGFIDP